MSRKTTTDQDSPQLGIKKALENAAKKTILEIEENLKEHIEKSIKESGLTAAGLAYKKRRLYDLLKIHITTIREDIAERRGDFETHLVHILSSDPSAIKTEQDHYVNGILGLSKENSEHCKSIFSDISEKLETVIPSLLLEEHQEDIKDLLEDIKRYSSELKNDIENELTDRVLSYITHEKKLEQDEDDKQEVKIKVEKIRKDMNEILKDLQNWVKKEVQIAQDNQAEELCDLSDDKPTPPQLREKFQERLEGLKQEVKKILEFHKNKVLNPKESISWSIDNAFDRSKIAQSNALNKMGGRDHARIPLTENMLARQISADSFESAISFTRYMMLFAYITHKIVNEPEIQEEIVTKAQRFVPGLPDYSDLPTAREVYSDLPTAREVYSDLPEAKDIPSIAASVALAPPTLAASTVKSAYVKAPTAKETFRSAASLALETVNATGSIAEKLYKNSPYTKTVASTALSAVKSAVKAVPSAALYAVTNSPIDTFYEGISYLTKTQKELDLEKKRSDLEAPKNSTKTSQSTQSDEGFVSDSESERSPSPAPESPNTARRLQPERSLSKS